MSTTTVNWKTLFVTLSGMNHVDWETLSSTAHAELLVKEDPVTALNVIRQFHLAIGFARGGPPDFEDAWIATVASVVLAGSPRENVLIVEMLKNVVEQHG